MTVSLMPSRPPYVRFEMRTEEDRAATIASGGLRMRDVAFAVIMQAGGKDTTERKAEDWLSNIARMATEGVYPPEWSDHFHREFAKWQAGQTVDDLGTSVRGWASVSPAMAENLMAAGVRTIEDVAAMNEQGMHRVGMGARELKNKAVAWLESREANKAAELISALRADSESKDTRIASLEAQVAELVASLPKKRA